MKKWFLAAALVMIAGIPAHAQEAASFGPHKGSEELNLSGFLATGLGRTAGEFAPGFGYYLSPNSSLNIAAGIDVSSGSGAPTTGQLYGNYRYHFVTRSKVIPYLGAGFLTSFVPNVTGGGTQTDTSPAFLIGIDDYVKPKQAFFVDGQIYQFKGAPGLFLFTTFGFKFLFN